MNIECFIQGEKTDAKLYSLIGVWLVNRSTHQQLGMPITAEPGDVWHVGILDGEAIGFALTRLQEDNAAHIRFLYADKSPVKTRQKLLTDCLRWLAEHQVSRVKTFAREEDQAWVGAGFTLTKRHKKGSFHTWEKEL